MVIQTNDAVNSVVAIAQVINDFKNQLAKLQAGLPQDVDGIEQLGNAVTLLNVAVQELHRATQGGFL